MRKYFAVWCAFAFAFALALPITALAGSEIQHEQITPSEYDGMVEGTTKTTPQMVEKYSINLAKAMHKKGEKDLRCKDEADMFYLAWARWKRGNRNFLVEVSINPVQMV